MLDDFSAERRPEQSVVAVVAYDAVENAITRTAAAYWIALKRNRALPARAQLEPRDMRAILSNVVLLRVIDDGRDYQYRIAGEAFVWAYSAQFRGLFLSDVEAANPEHGERMRALYKHVRQTAAPIGLQGWIGRNLPQARFVYHETVLLPFGDDGARVDHILIASFFVPNPSV
ncbi:MAG TPA: PAS domain-containing protein [Rhizomicrobium sp.]|nr:PAS domain-containing protein [Rhizomicrobium sp.]